MIHYLKIEQQYFDDILKRNKRFEIRYNDRNFKAGDTVVLWEIFTDKDKTIDFSGREIEVLITYILKNYKAVDDGYIIFSFVIS